MSKRTRQVADTIHHIVGTVIQNELKDPRVGFATVVGVDVSNDLQHAWVRISIMGDDEQRTQTMQGLQHARGYLRRRVAEEMNYLRFVPELHLKIDTSLDYSIHIEHVLRDVERERMQREQDPNTREQEKDGAGNEA